MKPKAVGISIVLIFVAIMAYDVYLYTDDIERNSITQVIIDWTLATPLVPWLGGFIMGFLTCHWWESYRVKIQSEKDKR